MAKFMQQLQDAPYNKLKQIAKKRNIGIQELVRSIIIPDYLEQEKQKALIAERKNNGVSESTSRVDP